MTLVDLVKEAGVVGAGGAGFPTHVKLASKAEYILMNAAECEPLLRVDQQLMVDRGEEILKGFYLAGKEVEAKEAIIGIKKKHKKVIETLKNLISSLSYEDYVKIKPLADSYPMGDEQVLVYELTGRVVPEMGIPINVGCVVMNSETALNVHRAWEKKSVVDSYITITGDVPNPITAKVPVGTPVSDVIALSGREDLKGYRVIGGGPMMGPLLEDTKGYITKKDKGFIVLKEDHPLVRQKLVDLPKSKKINKATCEQCRMCTDLCPRFLIGHDLEPHKSMKILNYGVDDQLGKERAQLCCQCNLCSYFACPAGLYPKQANDCFREELAPQKIRYAPQKESYKPRQQRSFRLVPSKRLIMRLGLHLFDVKAPLSTMEIEPEVVHILYSQSVGAPATPMVKVNQRVEKGEQIGAIDEGKLGAPIHASIAGTVVEVGDKTIGIRRD